MTSFLYSSAIEVTGSLGRLALSPLFSGPLLLAFDSTPNALREALADAASWMPEQVAALPFDPSLARTILRALFALSVVSKANSVLSHMASNSWRIRAAPGWDWSKEIAVVTGGSSGIGKSMVEKLAALGVRIAVFDIQDLPKDLQDRPGVSFYRCDVTSTESIGAAAAAVRRDIGHPSILINNAGIAVSQPILKVPEAFLRRILGVNLMSMWFTTQEFLPRMIQLNKGHVVTIASVASFVTLASATDYSATKAGALAFHEGLTTELKHIYKSPNVLTTVVHPNFVDTPLIADNKSKLQQSGVRLLTSEQISSEVIAKIQSRTGGQLIIPMSSGAVSGIRGWPSWLQELVRDVLGKGASPPSK